ncbi:hypothetical protein F511_14501 [Dorcoceras hygrometricum]|uniref:Uncharacterized protein n=1 Tax=Dorcoceras hygrometricum TaxID=472368 RepID=A0A2Z7AY83_9LAMI|nr:hypothetical protein F511_14501 [Dorcoceras hygrometricum]
MHRIRVLSACCIMLLTILGFDPCPSGAGCFGCLRVVQDTQVSQLVMEMTQLVVSREIPPRRRGRARGQIPIESEAQNEEVEHSVPIHRHARQVEDDVDVLVAHVDEMELIMTRFQRMNPQTFHGEESSSDAESWLQHIIGLFDRVCSPTSYVDAVDKAMDIEEGLQNRRPRVRPQVAQGIRPCVQGAQSSQPSQSS